MSKSKHNQSRTRGQPGYRNRGNLTGLDPMDTYAEASYMQGVFLRNLFTGRLRTRSQTLVVIMIILGLLLFSPLVLYIKAGIETGDFSPLGLICLVPLAGAGVMFCVNAARNLKPRFRSRQNRKRTRRNRTSARK